MKKLLSIAIVISMVFTMAGCLSSAYHFNGENEYPYNATADCWNYCVCVWDNKPKSDGARQPQCMPEKEEAIMQALKHYGII